MFDSRSIRIGSPNPEVQFSDDDDNATLGAGASFEGGTRMTHKLQQLMMWGTIATTTSCAGAGVCVGFDMRALPIYPVVSNMRKHAGNIWRGNRNLQASPVIPVWLHDARRDDVAPNFTAVVCAKTNKERPMRRAVLVVAIIIQA